MTVNYWGKDAIELHHAHCEHTIFVPRGHTAGHLHCDGCMADRKEKTPCRVELGPGA